MSVLKNGQAKYPFFGSPTNFITGLDPLGLQTTSEATYAYLLPGISNLTHRMRYYGFYCWLLDLYWSTHKKATKEDQYKFIRRGEFLASLIMACENPSAQQIMGSLFTRPLAHTARGSYFNLKEGADIEEGKATYWKYPAGAFGQYYVGPMTTIGLVTPAHSTEDTSDFIYKTTEEKDGVTVTGKSIATAYGQQLSRNAERTFLDAIVTGKVARADIPMLYKNFYLDGVDAESEEWSLYHQLLTERDEQLEIREEFFYFHRRNTIRDLIQDGNNRNDGYWNWDQYLINVYNEKPLSEEGIQETRTAWYYYQLNEYWHFSAGTILWSLLVELRKRVYDQPLNKFLADFVGMSKKSLKKLTALDTTGRDLDFAISHLKNFSEGDLAQNIQELIKEEAHIEALGYAWCLLLTLLRNNREHVQPLHEFAQKREINRDGAVSEVFQSLLLRLQKDFDGFLGDFTRRYIINRHQYVALRKMANSFTTTQKFFIEEGYLRFREVFAPRPTSPRLGALTNLLYDLNVIDDSDRLTESALTF